jgi:leucyl aminopeptidase (aminopeptidase T)
LHLYRNPPATWESYVESLEYDQDWYQSKGKALQQSLAGATTFEIISHNSIGEKAKVEVMGGLEIPKLNIGDYTDMNTVGGTFPIGEVFTESKVLESLNGSFWVYGFANSSFDIIMPDPFRVDITDGIVTGWSNNAPNEFIEVIALIKAQERAIVREIGFGLNRGIKRENPLGDITAYERVIGVHLSLGEKHSVYKKQGISAHKARFHVDLFLDIDEVLVDSQAIFKNGEYLI